MAELESSLISARVTAGMRAAESRGRHLGRASTSKLVAGEYMRNSRQSNRVFASFDAIAMNAVDRCHILLATAGMLATRAASAHGTDIPPAYSWQ